MPIILPNDPDSPLTQGDILKGVTLYSSAVSGSAVEPSAGKAELCIVLSRPCVAAHKNNVIVAEIRKQSPELPRDVVSFRDARDFLEDVRDGVDSPDRFYLGPIPAYEGRFFALLDRLYTIESGEANDLVSKRIAVLDSEFARDLHLRIFRAFASLGFDDVRWYATDDLRMLVRYGEKELADLKAQEQGEILQREQQQFRSRQFKEKTLNSVQSAIDELDQELTQFRGELERREAAEKEQS